MPEFPTLASAVTRRHLEKSEALQLLFDTIGKEAFVKLLEECGGVHVSIPRASEINPLVIDYVKENYLHDRRFALARHLNLTQARLRVRAQQAFGPNWKPPTKED